jgi:hypothetical protein
MDEPEKLDFRNMTLGELLARSSLGAPRREHAAPEKFYDSSGDEPDRSPET